jgi:hypothetical protein
MPAWEARPPLPTLPSSDLRVEADPSTGSDRRSCCAGGFLCCRRAGSFGDARSSSADRRAVHTALDSSSRITLRSVRSSVPSLS